MKCHIIGNGYSRKLFKDSEDFKICLNVYSYPCDLLFAIDDLAINYLHKNNFFGTNVVINNNINLESKYIIDRVPAYRKGIPFELEGMVSSESSFNVGHCAYQWTRKNNYTEIHLWGFDIFFDRSLVSLSDQIFGHTIEYKQSAKFDKKVEKYLKIWDNIIDIETYVHMPPGKNIDSQVQNKLLKGVNEWDWEMI